MEKFKKIFAGLIAVSTLAVGVTGYSINASAATTSNSYSIWLQRDLGAPSGSEASYQAWNYTTTMNYVEFDITEFTRSSGSSYSSVSCVANVNGSNVINANIATDLNVFNNAPKGKNGDASITLMNYHSGSHKVRGNFNF